MTTELGSYNVIAAYRDLERASDAIAELRQAGFDDRDLSIFGKSVEDVDVHSEYEEGEPLGGDVAKHVLAGGAGGGAVGAVLGAAGTAAVAAIPGVGLVVGTGALIGAIAGAFAGSTVGSIVEGQSALVTEAGWKQAFESMRAAIKEGAVVIGVHSNDRDEARRAVEVLRPTTPMSLRQLNDRGNEIDPGDDG